MTWGDHKHESVNKKVAGPVFNLNVNDQPARSWPHHPLRGYPVRTESELGHSVRQRAYTVTELLAAIILPVKLMKDGQMIYQDAIW